MVADDVTGGIRWNAVSEAQWKSASWLGGARAVGGPHARPTYEATHHGEAVGDGAFAKQPGCWKRFLREQRKYRCLLNTTLRLECSRHRPNAAVVTAHTHGYHVSQHATALL